MPARKRSRHLVLPRALRKPARILSRLDWEPPRHIGLKAMTALFLSTAVAGISIGGHANTVVSAATVSVGLAINEVKISGQSETSEVDILDGLAIGEFPSLLTFDVASARARVEALPWVKRATIRKLFPETLQVAIVEREPYAIWQGDDAVYLIDETGRRLADHIGDRYTSLPLVVGNGADERVGEFVALIDGVPSLAQRVKAGVLVAGRRWNVRLDDGVEILLPETDPAGALVQVVALDDGHNILSREIVSIDLRLPNRLVFRLTEEGQKARAALLKEREKAERQKRGA